MSAPMCFPSFRGTLLAFVTLSLAACAQPANDEGIASTTSPATASDWRVTIGAEDDGKTVTVREGLPLELWLYAPSQPAIAWSADETTLGSPATAFTPVLFPGSADPRSRTSFVWSTAGKVGRHDVVAQRAGEAESVHVKVVVIGAPAVAEVTLDASDAGRTVTLEEGTDLVVALPSEGMSEHIMHGGWEWIVDTDETTGSLGHFARSAFDAATRTQTMTWRTDRGVSTIGEHRVVLRYVWSRPWSGPPSGTRTFSFDVRVRAQGS